VKTLKPPIETRQMRGCVAVFAVLWLMGSCVPLLLVGAPLIFSIASGEAQVSTVAFSLLGTLLFTVPFFLVGIGLLVWSLWPMIVGLRVTRPEVIVSGDAVRPGDTFSFSFRQTFKRAAEVRQASFQLLLRETAIYRRGTNTYTVRHDFVAQRYDLPPRSFQAGETLSDQRLWQIPAEAMHTFVADRNRLRWLIVAQVGISGWPDFKEEYEVRVLPERL
jgi:hypothetical protein